MNPITRRGGVAYHTESFSFTKSVRILHTHTMSTSITHMGRFDIVSHASFEVPAILID